MLSNRTTSSSSISDGSAGTTKMLGKGMHNKSKRGTANVVVKEEDNREETEVKED